MQFIYRSSAHESLGDYKNTLIIGMAKAGFEFYIAQFSQFRQTQPVDADFQGADRFEKSGFKTAINGHDLTGGLHLRPQAAITEHEFVKWPARHLEDYVVDSRFKAGRGFSGDGIEDFVQVVADGDFGGHLGNGIPGGFGSQGAGTAHPRIHLDDKIFLAQGIQGKLYITSPGDPQGTDNF